MTSVTMIIGLGIGVQATVQYLLKLTLIIVITVKLLRLLIKTRAMRKLPTNFTPRIKDALTSNSVLNNPV